MKRLQSKILALALICLLFTLIMPAKVLAAESNIQIVNTEDEDYIIYVEGLAKTEFKFAISTKSDAEESELAYINSVLDGEGNQVALIEKEKAPTDKNYIYIKYGETVTTNEINFSDENQVFKIEDMKKVETTTTRIESELLTDVEKRNEIVDGIKYTETVGGLKINASEDSTYYYKCVKLPDEKYSELQNYADILNSEEYSEKDMYEKIQFAKEFNNLYKQLIEETELADKETAEGWTTLPEDMIIRQPIDAQQGEQYVVLLKQKTETSSIDDVEFLVSYREDEEEKIPGRTEQVVVQETAKLPVTGDNAILFVILAIVVIALIVTFIIMKRLQKKESRN